MEILKVQKIDKIQISLSFFVEDTEGADCVQNLTLSYRMVEKLWLPNVCIVNSKGSLIHQSPTPNVFLSILPNGTVWINYRLCGKIFRKCILFDDLITCHIQSIVNLSEYSPEL